MHKTVSGLVAIAAMACCTYARADAVASVTAVMQPVWIQLDDIESELDRSNDISLDDEEIALISRWVEQGAAQGELATAEPGEVGLDERPLIELAARVRSNPKTNIHSM